MRRRPLESPGSGGTEGRISETAPPGRQQARDKRNGRIGEIMPNPIPEQLRDPARPSSVMLRPVGGGCEWPVPPEHLERLSPAVTV